MKTILPECATFFFFMPIVDKGTISSRQSNDLANRVGRNIYIYNIESLYLDIDM